jgi:uncharacterized membrane protein YesL
MTMPEILKNFKEANIIAKILFFGIILLLIGTLIGLACSNFFVAKIISFVIIFFLYICVISTMAVFLCYFISQCGNYLFINNKNKDNLVYKWLNRKNQTKQNP